MDKLEELNERAATLHMECMNLTQEIQFRILGIVEDSELAFAGKVNMAQLHNDRALEMLSALEARRNG